jgi:CheY-like chemotaxis protein
MNNNRRIMIVDDEPYNILGLQIIISQSGFEGIEKLIDKANNGQEALDLVKSSYQKKEHSYGLIFMDCSMPVMNGYDASEAIRLFVK